MSAPGSNGYKPSEAEDFMSDRQQTYFREKLLAWKEEILTGSKTTISNLQQDSSALPDLVDRASAESDKALELRTRDRQRKLISKIEAALRRIDEGTYGYCEMTGEPISLRRLEARPTATLSLEAQEAHERKERTVRDD
ncbi:MAG: RNA polymerase-binding protein DksA [Pseudomonadota bacterium]